jgi:hypothetical protein
VAKYLLNEVGWASLIAILGEGGVGDPRVLIEVVVISFDLIIRGALENDVSLLLAHVNGTSSRSCLVVGNGDWSPLEVYEIPLGDDLEVS